MDKKIAFTPPNDEEIVEILDLLNDSDFSELRLEMDGLKLLFSKDATTPDQPLNPVSKQGYEPVSKEQPISPQSSLEMKSETVTSPDSTHQTVDRKETDPIEERGFVSIESPLLGIFYRAPKPGAPPFVEVGDSVSEDDTVCLVEVMKCFNSVKAGVKGRIARICVENNQMVEYNQTLFLLEPEGSPEESSST